jgi:uncharacterized OsmC-like protein
MADSKITISNINKMNFNISIKDKDREIDFESDQPVEGGGDDLAPTPVEMLVSSLGACVATMITAYAKKKQIDVSKMIVEVGFEKEKNPYRVSKITVDVDYPGQADEKLQKIIEKVASTCIVHHTLEKPPEISISFPWDK